MGRATVAPMSLEERLDAIRSSPVPPNEESAKFQAIRPILECLGWDSTDGSEFLFEYSVGGKQGGRVEDLNTLLGKSDLEVLFE